MRHFRFIYRVFALLCGSRKYPYPPHGRDWNFQGGGGGQRPRKILRGGGGLYRLYYFFQTGSIIPIC